MKKMDESKKDYSSEIGQKNRKKKSTCYMIPFT